MIDSFEYLLERNPIIQKVRPEASAHEFYQTQFNRYMHLYWKFQKDQVTIPRQIRAVLSINTGDEVVFEMDKNQVVLKKKAGADRNFEKY